MILPLITLLTLQKAPAKTFTELEERKYDAFTSLRTFKGHYAVVTTKADGTSMRQDFVFQFAPKGRQMLVIVNKTPTLEYGWNESQVWRVVYPEKSYSVTELKDALATPKFTKLPTQPGELSYVVGQTGVRFGLAPDPDLVGPVEEKLDDKPTRRYTATQKSESNDAEVTISQWLDADTDLVRQYEIKALASGRLQFIVKGILLDDDIKAILPSDVGTLPEDTLRNYRKVGG